MTRGNLVRIAGLVVVALVGATILFLVTPRPVPPPALSPSPPLGTARASSAPTAVPTARLTPIPTADVDVNSPLPIGWDQLVLPRLAAPWALDEFAPTGRDWVGVLRGDTAVGAVMLTVHLPGAYPSYDLQAKGLGAVRELARDDLQVFVGDRGALSGLRVEPEIIREIPVAGITGVRTAFRDIEIATGRVVSRYVFVYAWDVGGLWLFQTFWPPDPEGIGPIAFEDLEDQVAFDPILEKLLASVRLPGVLPSPVPFSP